MKNLLTFVLIFVSFSIKAQTNIKLDTASASCKIDSITFAANYLNYKLNGSSAIDITIVGNSKQYINASYTRFRKPDNGTFASRSELTAWIDRYFFVDASNSGGDLNLQAVTDNGNITTNTIQIANAVNDNEAVTKGQVYDIINGVGATLFIPLPRNVVTENDTTVSWSGTYTFTGSSPKVWVMPTVAAATGMTIFIINRGSANLTINSNAGANDLDVNGVYTNTILVLPTENYVLRGNSLKLVTVNN